MKHFNEIIVFDGECLICNRFYKWVLRNDKKNVLTTHQKYHLKKKNTDPEYLKKKVILMQEYRKRKKNEVQISQH